MSCFIENFHNNIFMSLPSLHFGTTEQFHLKVSVFAETRNGSGKYVIEKRIDRKVSEMKFYLDLLQPLQKFTTFSFSHFLVNIVRIRHIALWNILHVLPDSSDLKQRENRKVDLNDMLACFHIAYLQQHRHGKLRFNLGATSMFSNLFCHLQYCIKFSLRCL